MVENRILVPFTVPSKFKRGKMRTKAFAPLDEQRKFLVARLKVRSIGEVEKAVLRDKPVGRSIRRVSSEEAERVLFRYDRDQAARSPFYIKPFYARMRRFRALASKAGVGVEKLVEDLGRTALFEREGERLDSPEGRRILLSRGQLARERVVEAVSKFVGAGLLHGHPHAGNIAITPQGRVIIFDFALAKPLVLRRGKKKQDELSALRRDLRDFSSTFADCLGYLVVEQRRKARIEILREVVQKALSLHKNGKAVTAAEKKFLLRDWKGRRA